MFILVLLLILVAIFLATCFTIYWKLVRPEKYVYDALRSQGIPGEPFVPILGQMPEIRRARDNDALFEYHESLAKKHGPVFLIGYGPLVRLVVLEPDMLADVLGRSHISDYTKPKDFTTVLKPLIGSHNLLVSTGLEHERARQMLNPAFHFVNLQSMVSIMADRTAKAIHRLLESSSNQSIDLQKELNSLTLTIIASSAFGQGFETIVNAKAIMFQTFTEALEAIMYRTMRMVNLLPFLAQLPFWRKNIVDRATQMVDTFVDQIISDRRQGKSTSSCVGADLLDLLLSAVDDQGQPFTDEEIKEQALTFVLAGHETTGNLMTWLMYILTTHEHVLHACREEIDRVLPNGLEPTYDHLSSLFVCEAVIYETLRLYPPAPLFTRYCIRAHTIGSKGHKQLHIPVHTTVWLNTYTLHRRAEFWSRPYEFDYTRWLRDPCTGLKPKLAHPFCYLPFSAGPRNCIGQHFALLEAKVVLSMFLQRCNIQFEPGQKITPDIRITMRPKYGLFGRITRRQ
ncbi:unnamed protein product [Rotaria sp. Silwood2]|nr:unnamed protein product [Rotaria sp. Silwood2]CAF3013488.1 unnamed protein product [Rotaria sp. Silwood2]CAF3345545.1 unnamed protein product [Rotaria sp. Silwood2]CAF4077741.1 unnamed protein product [Rotaria sp. Silwood2]CAF4256221.1 unnamed protein product [Rotaria sp. Silwood2]